MHSILAADATESVKVLWSLSEWLLEKVGRADVTVVLINVISALVCMILPYLLGSIQPAVILSRYIWHGDIRSAGNGKPDTVNMLDQYGWWAAILTVVCNVLKVVLAFALGLSVWGFNGRAVASFFVLFGHLFPLYHRFRGGRGVTCLLLSAFLFDPITGAIITVIFLVGTVGTRMVSFGTLLAAVMYPIILNAFYVNPDLCIAMAVLSTLFLVIAHWENIRKIPQGKEEKVKFSRYFSRGGHQK